mmetsp:Transcript_15654/g.39033  ORF Transcript_15654/g.39033 Transcript_15654/m.39033 type:complete len:503 (+) Transcript_15654:116-1624(+)
MDTTAGRQITSSAFGMLTLGPGETTGTATATTASTSDTTNVDIHSEEFKSLLGKPESELDNALLLYNTKKAGKVEIIFKIKKGVDTIQQNLETIRAKRASAMIYMAGLDRKIQSGEKNMTKLCKVADREGQDVEDLDKEFAMANKIKATDVFTTFDSKEDIVSYLGMSSPFAWKALNNISAEALARSLDNGGFNKTEWCGVKDIKTTRPRMDNGGRVTVSDFTYYLMHDVMQIEGAYDTIFGKEAPENVKMPAAENKSTGTTITMEDARACMHYGIDPSVWVTFPPASAKKLIAEMEEQKRKHGRGGDDSDDTPTHQNKKLKTTHFSAVDGPVTAAAAPAAAAPAAGGGVASTLSGLQGAGHVWGADGIAVGKEESDIRGHDGFSKFTDACAAAGIDLDAAAYTIFAPTDSCLESYEKMRGPVTADVLKMHIVEGKIASSDIPSATLNSLNGPLTYRYAVRKHFVNDAIIGETTFGAGADFPIDVSVGNSVIHTVGLCFGFY